jgi:putative heme-binding domain-containing protein
VSRSATLALLAGLAGATAAGERAAPAQEAPVVESADDTVYADEPYWYKPGHPLHPAQAEEIRTQPGFVVERVVSVPEELGSWTALTADGKGRLIAAAQQRGGLFRVTPPGPGQLDEARVEVLGGAATRVGWSHGLLAAGQDLYVTVAEENETAPAGLYRLADRDGDEQFESLERLLELEAVGEHGPHALVADAAGEWLYLIGGNGLAPPAGIERRRTVATTGTDHLMPPGFDSSRYTPAGWVVRFRPDGSGRELVASGLRNAYDLAFNRLGDLFSFDSDMEWDLGAPWYRPTRVCHLVSGAELGWRGDAAKWPAHYEDSVPPVIDIGPGSPTGISFGYGAAFPPRYREALFVGDWTFGAIHAVHLRPEGAGYAAEFEEFAGGPGLPVTDLVVGGDGALYFVVGGRRLRSALYRIRYVGDEPISDGAAREPVVPPLHALRRRLEAHHGSIAPETAGAVWPHLGHPDRLVRYAARVALEARPAAAWTARALGEEDPSSALTALLALARQGEPAVLPRVLARASALPWDELSGEQRLTALRVYELALARAGDRSDGTEDVASVLRGRFPDPNEGVSRELARLLCHLGDTSMIEPLLERMSRDSGERPFLGLASFARNPKYGQAIRDILESAPLVGRMHYAQMLLWIREGWGWDQRRRYFESIADAKAHSRGGYTYLNLWDRIRDRALLYVPKDRRGELASIDAPRTALSEEVPVPVGPGRSWTREEALSLVEGGLGGRDPEAGRRAYRAAGCSLCHRIAGEGGSTGPDLSALGERFSVPDIVDSILDPSRTIAYAYRVHVVETRDGRTLSGRIASRDGEVTRIAENLMRPGESVAVPNATIRRERPVPVSTMPSGLADVLNADELLDLLAYLVSGAGPAD